MIDVIIDSLIDSSKVLPFLFAVYVIIEIIEKKLMFATRAKKLLRGKFAPLMGVGMGLIPQCGFSVMATNLYISRNITVGTLIAVFISTSDEAIPILLSSPSTAWKLLPMLGVKILYALFIGYLLDLIFWKRNVAIFTSSEEKAKEEVHEESEIGCCHHELKRDEGEQNNKKDILKTYLLHPLVHSVKVFLYILIINFLFGTLIYFVGQDKITVFLSQSGWYQPVIAGLIGLIPNCASSVIISQLYILGGISFGSCVAGLCVNAGMGVALLFRKNKNIKENLFVLGVLYLAGVLLGFILTPIPW